MYNVSKLTAEGEFGKTVRLPNTELSDKTKGVTTQMYQPES